MILPWRIPVSDSEYSVQPDSSTMWGMNQVEPSTLQTLQALLLNTKMEGIGFVLYDALDVILEISPFACELLDIDEHAANGLSLRKMLRQLPNERQELLQGIIHQSSNPQKSYTWGTKTRNYELLIDTHLLCDRQTEIVGGALIFRDITAQRMLEDQLRHSDRLVTIGKVAAGAAHEIRNPLTSLKGFLQLLQKSLCDHGMQREKKYTDVMLSEVERINRLVDEFLLLGRPKEWSAKPVNMSDILADIIPLIQSEAMLHDISVHCHCDDMQIQILADAEQLKQVILNICKNAIEAMEQQGEQLTIRERINRHEQTYVLEILDQGPGIPPFLIDKIFDPFFTTKEKGSGLGLPICQRILQDIGGQLRISSRGFGTVAQLVLPIHFS